MLFDAACRLFEEELSKESRLAAERGAFPAALWGKLADAGFLHPSVPEELGGVGGDPLDEFAILRAAGRHAAPGPLPETMLAGWLAAACGQPVPDGPLSVAPVNFADRLRLHRAAGNYKLEGEARRVAWASAAGTILLLAETDEGGAALVRLEPGGIRRVAEANMAGEPRETLAFRNFSLAASLVTKVEATDLRERLMQRGAAMRAALMAGALEGVLARAVGYAGERVQFGRAIGKFQAVQQELAKLAGQTAAALVAAEGAYGAIARGGDALAAIAVAKARVGEAAGIGAAIGHQVHGAMGFTHEHDLHFLTRRLWSWRDEYGNEARWQIVLGRAAARAGGDGLWPMVAAI